jgi:hypothetical protein
LRHAVPQGCHSVFGESDVDLGAQPVKREALGEVRRAGRGAVEQEPVLMLGHEELEQDLTLRSEQRRIDALAGCACGHVVADQTLQERARLRSPDGNDGTVFEKRRVRHESCS